MFTEVVSLHILQLDITSQACKGSHGAGLSAQCERLLTGVRLKACPEDVHPQLCGLLQHGTVRMVPAVPLHPPALHFQAPSALQNGESCLSPGLPS